MTNVAEKTHMHTPIHELFREQARRSPEAPALLMPYSEPAVLSFGEVEILARRGAGMLQKMGVSPGDRVGLLVRRSWQSFVGVLATWNAGALYVPFSLDDPELHRNQIAVDASLSAWLVDHEGAALLPSGAPHIVLDDLMFVTEHALLPCGAPAAACILYTSGSTGRPKGVVNTHRAQINRFQWWRDNYPLAEDDRLCHRASLRFIDSLWEMFCCTLQGRPIVISPEAAGSQPLQLARVLFESKVTRLVTVPTLLRSILDLDVDVQAMLSTLRLCVVGGEVMSVDLARRFRKLASNCALVNAYGQTETAADVTCYRVLDISAEASSIPIGAVVNGLHLFVLNDQLRRVPTGTMGELFVGGTGLAAGYWNRDDLTAERFLSLPDIFPDGLLFRTGDLGREVPGGCFEFCGRLDQQVKLRGYRIELDEIEAALRRHPGVGQVGLVHQTHAGVCGRIIAFVAPKQSVCGQCDTSILNGAELRHRLQQELPDYMIPSEIFVSNVWPTLPSGKVDLAALVTTVTSPRRYGDANPLEETLAGLWSEVLGVTSVGPDVPFFEAGGHSLAVVQLAKRLSQALGICIDDACLFANPTVRKQAAWVEELLRRKNS